MTKPPKKKIVCAYCGTPKLISRYEYKRQRRNGRTRFFCSSKCAVTLGNKERGHCNVEVKRICPWCKEEFTTHSGYHGATFCSRSCASAGSVTEARRAAGRAAGRDHPPTIRTIAAALRKREAWKYKLLRKLLRGLGERYKFEHAMGSYVFDLALPTHKVLVEFDAPYPDSDAQQVEDRKKTATAKRHGWAVVRVKTPPNEVIKAKVLFPVLARFS